MPGQDLSVGVNILPPLDLGSLKGHKILPRRRIISDDADYGRSIRQERRTRHKSEQISYSSAERIKSWIPEASPIQVIPVVGKPLTPPINFRDDFQSWINDVALRSRDLARRRTSESLDNTPLVQQSPPTPETTPPKTDRSRTTASRSSTRDTSNSRTESFTTAHETQSSDDESQSLDSPSKHPAREKWLRSSGFSKERDVGLGLGLEPEDEETTPRDMAFKHVAKHQDFGSFDGIWDVSDEDRQEGGSQGGHSSATSVPYDRRSHKHSKTAEIPTLDSPTLGQETETSLDKSLSLRQRVENSRRGRPGVPNEKFTEEIHGPLEDDHFDVEAELRDMNNKRLSQTSAASTVVEAMVIESPPRRRQTLRHTVKMEDMNSTTPPPPSNRNSLNSNERSSIRRRLRRSKSPDNELRKSYASADTPESVGSNPPKVRQDLVPAIAFSNRLSSIPSSASDKKNGSRTVSLASRPQSPRPTTAPDDSAGYFDVPPRHDRRTMSVVIQPAKLTKYEGKPEQRNDLPALPQLPSPSVPASSEVSRTTSAFSAGMCTRFDPPTPADQPRATLYLSDPPDDHNRSVDRNMGEWSAIRPRSTLVTPFSLRSARSSTPGTLEVNEATAISIYPHTNKSILVIQQMPGGSDSSPREQSAIIAGNANIALPGSITPIIHHQSPPREVLTSPLQNPRDAPQPPDLRVIAPTPANARPSSEATPPMPSAPARTNPFSAPMSSIRRAISARRVSESFVSPLTKTFSLRGTAGTPRRRRTLGHAAEPGSKLHPFWRPRGFWDAIDDSDSDEEFGNTGFLTGSQRPSLSIKDAPTRRTNSLTNRLRASLHLPHSPRRSRRFSLSSESDSDLYEFVNANSGRDHEECKRDGVLIQPKLQTEENRKGDTAPKRTMSLTRRLTESFRLPHPARSQRPLSISYPLTRDNNTSVPQIGQEDASHKEDIIPWRTMSLTRRLTGSLRFPHRERRERPRSKSASLHLDQNESIKPPPSGGEEWRSEAATRRTVSLTRRLTESLRLPHREWHERPMSISAPLHPEEDEYVRPRVNGAADWKSDIKHRRTVSLTGRLTRSTEHPARPPRPLSMSSPLDQGENESVHPNVDGYAADQKEKSGRAGHPVHFVGFRAFAEKMERKREAREEGKREARRRWLTDSIRRVGGDEDAAPTEHFKREMGGGW